MGEKLTHVDQVFKGQLLAADLVQDGFQRPSNDFLPFGVSCMFDNGYGGLRRIIDRELLDELRKLRRHGEQDHRALVDR